MSKPVKSLITKEIQARFGQLDSVLVVNPIGLDAIATTQLRAELRKNNIELEVVRNALTARALKGTAIENVGEVLTGTSAFMTGGESIVDVARVAVEWAKKMERFEIRGAVVEGDVLDAKGVDVLSKMPSRVELQGQIAMLANSPGRRVAGAILGPARKIAGCIKAVEEKLEKESGSVAAA